MTTQRLLSMPNYRPEIVLDAGITVQLVGGTQVQVLPGDLQAPPALEIVFGRVVLQPVAQGGRQLQLTFGGRSGVLTLVDSGSITAVEVTFYHVPGTNPETEAPHMVAELYVGHGAVRWQDKNQQEPLRIMAPARVVLGGPAPPEAQPLENKDLPKWIEPEPLTGLGSAGADRPGPVASGRAAGRIGAEGIGRSSPQSKSPAWRGAASAASAISIPRSRR